MEAPDYENRNYSSTEKHIAQNFCSRFRFELIDGCGNIRIVGHVDIDNRSVVSHL